MGPYCACNAGYSTDSLPAANVLIAGILLKALSFGPGIWEAFKIKLWEDHNLEASQHVPLIEVPDRHHK